jgi:hypothetical protein
LQLTVESAGDLFAPGLRSLKLEAGLGEVEMEEGERQVVVGRGEFS